MGTLAGVLFILGLTALGGAKPQKPPHIVFMIVDDLVSRILDGYFIQTLKKSISISKWVTIIFMQETSAFVDDISSHIGVAYAFVIPIIWNTYQS